MQWLASAWRPPPTFGESVARQLRHSQSTTALTGPTRQWSPAGPTAVVVRRLCCSRGPADLDLCPAVMGEMCSSRHRGRLVGRGQTLAPPLGGRIRPCHLYAAWLRIRASHTTSSPPEAARRGGLDMLVACYPQTSAIVRILRPPAPVRIHRGSRYHQLQPSRILHARSLPGACIDLAIGCLSAVAQALSCEHCLAPPSESHGRCATCRPGASGVRAVSAKRRIGRKRFQWGGPMSSLLESFWWDENALGSLPGSSQKCSGTACHREGRATRGAQRTGRLYLGPPLSDCGSPGVGATWKVVSAQHGKGVHPVHKHLVSLQATRQSLS